MTFLSIDMTRIVLLFDGEKSLFRKKRKSQTDLIHIAIIHSVFYLVSGFYTHGCLKKTKKL